MWAAAVLFYFGLAVAGQAGLRRLGWIRNSVFDFLIAGCVCGSALIAHSLADRALTPNIGTSIICYAFLSEFYIFLFTFAGSSVGVSILRMLEKKALTQAQIDEALSPERMVDGRVFRLIQAGFLRKKDLNYYVTPKGKCLAACFQLMKSVFKTR